MAHTVTYTIHGTTWTVQASEWNGYSSAELAAHEIAAALRTYPADIIQRIHAEYLADIHAGNEPVLPDFIHRICKQARAKTIATWVTQPNGGCCLDVFPR